MVIPDTSIWVEFFKGKLPFLDELTILLEESQVYALECIFAELLQGALNNRERQIIDEYWQNLPKPQLDHILIRAGWQSGKHRWFSKGIGLIDSTIIVTARDTSSVIWTLDKKLKNVCTKAELYK